MTAGFFSPMPPARTGVADYSAALVEAMRDRGEVRVGADGDVNVYQLGNNALHRDMYERALRRPGVVVLHDAVLHHFLLGQLTRDEYVGEFVYNYGEWHRQVAEKMWDRRARSGADPAYFDYPLLKRQMDRAAVVVVHNAAAARMARQHGARRVVEIPHLYRKPALPADFEVIRLREALKLGARRFVFGVFGHLRESKRLTSVLRAFDNVVAGGVDAALLVAGEFVSTDLARALEPLLMRERILRVGYTPERDFWRTASAVDACINLRYPQAGETSGIAIRLMGIGKPVVVTSGEETAAFPESACLRVDAGVTEIDMLSDYMTWLAQSPSEAREIGARAARHIAGHHAPQSVAEAYWRALESAA